MTALSENLTETAITSEVVSPVLTPEAVQTTLGELAGLTPREALNRAVVLHQGGQFKASIPYYIHAVQRDVIEAGKSGRSVDPDILHAAGVALAMGGKRREAIEFLESALKHGKHHSGACWSALGLAYVETRNYGKAERCYKMACRYDPHSAANWIGFANLACAGGNLRVGEMRYEKGLSCPARDPEELIAQGMTYLRKGHWRKGWRGYEARRLTAMWADRNPHVTPLRDAKDLIQYSYWRQPSRGDVVYVLTEQGFGDAVQFARYIPTFQERFGVRVILQSHDALVDLLQGALPDIPVQGRKAPRPACTGWAMLLSLPAILREADAGVVPPPIQPFGLTWHRPAGTRVFVHSRGNAQHGYAFDRDCPPNVMEDAVRAAGYEVVVAPFTNLAGGGQTAVMAEPTWRETVDLLMTCSRCFTVDTGLCHVAGSLGIPTDIAVPTIPEWRWLRPNATTTPMYPSARLIHRSRTERWDEVAQQITHILSGERN